MTGRTVTAVLPTRDRPRTVRRTIERLAALPEIAAIIVVDDGSAEPVAPILAPLVAALDAHGVALTLLRHDRPRGAGASRATGTAHLATPHLLMMDDDILLCAGALSAIRAFADAHGSAIVGCRLVYAGFEDPIALDTPPAGLTARLLDERVWEANFQAAANGPVALPFVSAVCLWPAAAVAAIGAASFDGGYVGNGYREETHPQLVYGERGGSVWYLPDAVAYHLSAPADEVRSGQHVTRRWRYEWEVLVNNARFLRRFDQTLRRWRGGRAVPLVALQTAFIVARLRTLTHRAIRRTGSRLRQVSPPSHCHPRR